MIRTYLGAHPHAAKLFGVVMRVLVLSMVMMMFWRCAEGARQRRNCHEAQQQGEQLGTPRGHSDSPGHVSEDTYLMPS
jgi:flagellar biosynthesis/type III secretory pathway M-ring protein FliF/YscJ